MGKLDENLCYICLKENLQVKNLSESDEDNLTFKEKLIYCVPTALVNVDDWFICQDCVLLLRDSHKFINMVISSQEYLKICNEQITIKSEDVCSDLDQEIDVITPDLIKVDEKVPVNHKDIDKDSKFHCKICNIKFKTKSLLSNHLQKTHNCIKNDSGLKNDKTEPSPANFTCKFCKTKLESQSLLERHIKLLHIKNNHYQCHYCKKTFKQSSHLHDHITTHLQDENYKCILCDKTFLRVTSLRRHFKTHDRAPGEKIKPSPVLCTICGKKMPYSNGLQRHMRTHLGVKEHECEFCKRKFSQKTHLLAHRRTHTGEKPYICDTCGEAFTLNASLRKHLNTHKKNVKVEYTCY